MCIIALWVEYPSYHHFTEGVTQRCCHLLKVTELLRRSKQFSGQHQRLSSQNPRPFPPALSVLMCLRWRPPFPPVLWSSSLCVSCKYLKGRAVAQPSTYVFLSVRPIFPLHCSQCLFLYCEDWLDGSCDLDPPCTFEKYKKVLLSTRLAVCSDEHVKASKLRYRASLLLSASLKGGPETSFGGQGSRKNKPSIEMTSHDTHHESVTKTRSGYSSPEIHLHSWKFKKESICVLFTKISITKVIAEWYWKSGCWQVAWKTIRQLGNSGREQVQRTVTDPRMLWTMDPECYSKLNRALVLQRALQPGEPLSDKESIPQTSSWLLEEVTEYLLCVRT